MPIAEAVTEQRLVPLDSDILLTSYWLDISPGEQSPPVEEMDAGN